MNNLLIASSRGLLREGLELLCRQSSSMGEVAAAADRQDIDRLCARIMFDVMIIDPLSLVRGGCDEVSDLKKQVARLKEAGRVRSVLAIVDAEIARSLWSLLHEGYDGLIFSGKPFYDARLAIEAAFRGETYLPESAAESLTTEYSSGTLPLTPRELDIVRLLGSGFSSKEIAFRLQIKVGTFETYRKRVMRKIGVGSIAELTSYAIRIGLLHI